MRVDNRTALLDGDEPELREAAVEIVEAALAAVHPERLLDRQVERNGDVLTVDERTYDLDDFDAVRVLGVGKGAGALTAATLDLLDGHVTEALVVEKDAVTIEDGAFDAVSGKSRVIEAGHPIPNEASAEAGTEALNLADRSGPDDLVISCITGGASALLVSPTVPLEAVAETNDALLGAGAPIEEINAVRKHLSKIKGGLLADRIAPATALGLIVVDEVAGDPWGPTVADPTTYDDALEVLDRYDLRESIPDAVREYVGGGARGEHPETPTARSVAHNVVLADATDVCRPATDAARERGFDSLVLSTKIEGEASEVGVVHGGVATDAAEAGQPLDPPVAIISGGEATVTLSDDPGSGGPNQEAALGFARAVTGVPGVLGAFVGTDGTDGPTDIAGGLATGRTSDRAKAVGEPIASALDRNDAATTLRALDDAVITGATHINLMDLRVVLVDDRPANDSENGENDRVE